MSSQPIWKRLLNNKVKLPLMPYLLSPIMGHNLATLGHQTLVDPWFWIGLLHIPWLYFLGFRTGFLKASCCGEVIKGHQ